MNKLLITLTGLIIFLGYMLYDTRRDLNIVERDYKIFRAETIVNKLLTPVDVKYFATISCYTLTIKENFDDNFKWHIDIQSAQFKRQEDSIIFSGDNSISKSWFPPREPTESGGVGNSVLIDELSYTLPVGDINRSNSIVSHLNGVKNLCK